MARPCVFSNSEKLPLGLEKDVSRMFQYAVVLPGDPDDIQ